MTDRQILECVDIFGWQLRGTLISGHNQTLGQDSGGAIVYEYTNIEIAVTSPHTTPKLFF